MLNVLFTRFCRVQRDKATRRKGKLYNENHNLYFVTKYDKKIEDSGLQGISTCGTDKKCKRHWNRKVWKAHTTWDWALGGSIITINSYTYNLYNKKWCPFLCCSHNPSENEDSSLKFWHNNFYVYHPVVLTFILRAHQTFKCPRYEGTRPRALQPFKCTVHSCIGLEL